MNSLGADPPAARQLTSETSSPSHHGASVADELLVVTSGSMGVLSAFILAQPSAQEHSLALDAIREFYGNQPDCQVTHSSEEGDAVQQARACGVLDSDIQFISDDLLATYSDIITQGISLLEARAAREAQADEVRARLLASSITQDQRQRISARNITVRGQRAAVAATPSVSQDHPARGGATVAGGIPLQVDFRAAAHGSPGRLDELSAVTGVQSHPVAQRPAPLRRGGQSAPPGGYVQGNQGGLVRGGSAPLPLGRRPGPQAGRVLPPPPPRFGGGGGGGGGTGGGGNGGGGGAPVPGASQTSGSSSSSSADEGVSLDNVTKLTKFVCDGLQGLSPITCRTSWLQFFTNYCVLGAQAKTLGLDIMVHTVVNGNPVFKTTESNKEASSMWFSVLIPMCMDPKNPLASRAEAMLSKGESGAEAMALLRAEYLGESSVESSFNDVENLLFMAYDPNCGVSRTLYVTKATDLMDKIQRELPDLVFSPIIRVFLCLRILDKAFVQKVREWLVHTDKSIESLDVERIHTIIKKLEGLKSEFGPSSKPPSSNHSASDSGNDASANASDANKAGWKDGFAILTKCPLAEKNDFVKKSIKGMSPCVFCLAPSSETSEKKVSHAAASCPTLTKLGYTMVGCDERGNPTNTKRRKEEIARLKKEIEDLKAAKAKEVGAKTAETGGGGSDSPAGFSATVEEVAEPKKWSDAVMPQGAFEELDL